MNVYEADIWRSIYHNGKFITNASRKQLIHALNEERAKKKIILKPAETTGQNDYTVKTGQEFIYSLRKTGTVVIKPYYEYSDGRCPRPVQK